MGFLGRITGWEQQGDAHNAVVASHFIRTATAETKALLIERIIEIQADVKGRYAGSRSDILNDLNSQPRSVQMNFVALACNSLGIPPNLKGLHFNNVRNPYLAGKDDTTERIEGVVRFINRHHGAGVSWPGNSDKVDFTEWLTPAAQMATINCPGCRQAVRVPGGRKLNIKCPKCAQAWIQQT